MVVKLADMGEARMINSPPKRDIPPIPARNWAPPEVGYGFLSLLVALLTCGLQVLVPNAKADSYTIKSDIYGLCIVLSEVRRSERNRHLSY